MHLNAEYWRRRAQEIWALAEQVRYPQPRAQMRRLAAECDTLAERQGGSAKDARPPEGMITRPNADRLHVA